LRETAKADGTKKWVVNHVIMFRPWPYHPTPKGGSTMHPPTANAWSTDRKAMSHTACPASQRLNFGKLPVVSLITQGVLFHIYRLQFCHIGEYGSWSSCIPRPKACAHCSRTSSTRANILLVTGYSIYIAYSFKLRCIALPIDSMYLS